LRARVRRCAAVLRIAAFFCLLLPSIALAGPGASGPILSAAEALFQTMKAGDSPGTWRVLTAKSRDTIVAETDASIRKAGGPPVPPDRIREDFASGGPISRQYWDGFLRRFHPDEALEKSRWEMGPVEKDRAEVLITHPGADRPAVLRMFREGEEWKAGLVETFW